MQDTRKTLITKQQRTTITSVKLNVKQLCGDANALARHGRIGINGM